jgi:hypothetical protein
MWPQQHPPVYNHNPPKPVMNSVVHEQTELGTIKVVNPPTLTLPRSLVITYVSG